MNGTILVIGTLDTKGSQIAYLKDVLEQQGANVAVLDIGILGQVPFEPEVTRERVAEAAGTDLEGIIALEDQHRAMLRMTEGAKSLVGQMHERGEVEAIVGVGGSMATAALLEILQVVPLGIPKVLLSTLTYSRLIGPDLVAGSDIIMVPWIGGLWGLNALSASVIETAAGAALGAARSQEIGRAARPLPEGRPIAGVTGLGSGIDRFLGPLEAALAERGYETAVFHATGMSSRAFERSISDGKIQVSLDLSAGVDLLNQLVGSPAAPGPHRLEAAGELGLPQIVSPGAIGVFHWSDERRPQKYQERPSAYHNPIIRSGLSEPQEMGEVAEVMAEKLNRAKGPTTVVIPMGSPHPPEIPEKIAETELGVFMKEHELRWGPGMVEFRDRLRAALDPRVEVKVIDGNNSDPAYVGALLEAFDKMVPVTA